MLLHNKILMMYASGYLLMDVDDETLMPTGPLVH
jgi:hypothetical protein